MFIEKKCDMCCINLYQKECLFNDNCHNLYTYIKQQMKIR